MKTVKQYIDKTMKKIMKIVEIPDRLKGYTTYCIKQVNNQTCYCVTTDGVNITVIPIENFYNKLPRVIARQIEIDLQKYETKLYARILVKE